MRAKFEKFIEKNYKGLNFISIPSEAYKPGVLLNDDDRIFAHLSRIFKDEQKWKIKQIKANIPNQVINGERDLDLGITLLGIISLKGGFESSYTVSFEFNDVSEVVFDTENGGAYENEVRTLIQNLKKSDQNTWHQILHKYVAMEIVIVNSVTVEFKRNGKALGEIDLPQIENELSINGKYLWGSNGKMEIKNDNNVPFGVLGFQIKRGM